MIEAAQTPDRFTFLRRLGAGGMGEVWEATLHGPGGFEKAVAVKRLRTGLGEIAEKQLLEQYLPHWKKFTGWVAAAMSREREAEEAGAALATKTKAALPQSRRAAPTVNLDAGAWAMQPGKLPAAVEKYRWALEELRLAMFTPELASKNAPTVAGVAQMWKGLSP